VNATNNAEPIQAAENRKNKKSNMPWAPELNRLGIASFQPL
jgi:hypothetical protein